VTAGDAATGPGEGPVASGDGDGHAQDEPGPLVAVVGRPNVGKSSLVNRIVGRRVAIVEERPGVTRDRKEMMAEWNGRPFTLVDTGGWLDGTDGLEGQVSAQAERAVRSADLVLLVVDVTVGVTDEDEAVATFLRRSHRPVALVVNKVDSDGREADAWAFARLGLGDPWMVSALHGRGAGELLDEIVRRLPTDREIGPAERTSPPASVERGTSVSIVGRPNVGKSTLFNRLIGDDRSITHDLPGTTRDTIDTLVETDEGPLRFVDTAGMRRKSRVGEGAEYYSLVRSLQAIDHSDVALLLLDATEGVTHQDQRLAERVDAAGSPVVLVLNKWDLLDAEARSAVTAEVGDRLAFLGYAPVIRASARTGLGVHRLLPALGQAIEAYHQRVPTTKLNRVLQSAQAAHPAPAGARVLYGVQGASDPPTFTLFTNRSLHQTYLRYLERRLREELGFGPTPLKLRVRRRSR
jgi:GTPase